MVRNRFDMARANRLSETTPLLCVLHLFYFWNRADARFFQFIHEFGGTTSKMNTVATVESQCHPT
jgi:hypothetical protein